jgi:hypothetical protein
MGSKAEIMFPNASFSKWYPSTPVKTTRRSRSCRLDQSGRRARSLIVRRSQSTAYETKRLSWRDCSATGVYPSRLLDTLTQKPAASELPLLAHPYRSRDAATSSGSGCKRHPVEVAARTVRDHKRHCPSTRDRFNHGGGSAGQLIPCRSTAALASRAANYSRLRFRSPPLTRPAPAVNSPQRDGTCAGLAH